MNTARRERIKEIFHAATNLPADKRAAYVDDMCASDKEIRDEVLSLLSHDDPAADAFSDDQLAAVRGALENVVGSSATGAASFSSYAPIDPPTRVGRYEILHILGQGGMGVVYEARQDNPKRTVAVKVIRPGLSTNRILQRFEHEAQVLGRLQHPGIAHIYEAGVAEVESAGGLNSRQPFFAMEIVRGRPLVEYVREQNLSTNARLTLLASICDAVAHAHEQGVIHRDLKPNNILVNALGQPKILDFGVARLTDSDLQVTTMRTDVGQLVGTLPYMSPEQVAADSQALDARSDVYALGVLLYEMLSGKLPHDLPPRSIPEAVRIITTVEPSRLSSFNTVFRGDVETIVSKALAKEPARRYQSAGDLAVDLRRYLANQPIAARPPSTMYQFRKFARRNQAAVIGAAAVFVVLVVGTITTTVGMIRARQAEALANTRYEDAQAARRETEESLERARAAENLAQSAQHETQAVNDFLNQILYSADPARHGGHDMSVREALDEAATRIDEFAQDAPGTKAAIHQTIGTTYTRIGLVRKATRHFEAALSIRRKLFASDDVRTIRSVSKLGQNLYACGELDRADTLLRESVSSLRTNPQVDNEQLARQLCTLGRINKRRARYANSIAFLRESIALHRKRGPTADGLADALSELGAVLSREGLYLEAEKVLREALEIQRQVHGPDSAYAGGILSVLSVSLKRRGNLEEAENINREALKILRATHGLKHPSTLTATSNLAGLLAERGSHVEAEALFREALPVSREIHGDDSIQVAIACAKLADALRRQGQLTEAEEYAREALQTFTTKMGEHPYTARAQSELGTILLEGKRYEPAAEQFQAAAEIYRVTLGDDHPIYPDTLTLLAVAKREAGETRDAETIFAQAEALLLADFATVTDDSNRANEVRAQLAERIARFYTQWGKPTQASEWDERHTGYVAEKRPPANE